VCPSSAVADDTRTHLASRHRMRQTEPVAERTNAVEVHLELVASVYLRESTEVGWASIRVSEDLRHFAEVVLEPRWRDHRLMPHGLQRGYKTARPRGATEDRQITRNIDSKVSRYRGSLARANHWARFRYASESAAPEALRRHAVVTRVQPAASLGPRRRGRARDPQDELRSARATPAIPPSRASRPPPDKEATSSAHAMAAQD